MPLYTSKTVHFRAVLQVETPGARFTEYLTTILRLSYDNTKVKIDVYDRLLIYKTSYEERKVFLSTIHSGRRFMMLIK